MITIVSCNCNCIYLHCISSTQEYKYLGTILDQSLSFRRNFEALYKRMSSRLRLLSSLKYLLPTDTIIKIYKAILLPTMLYNCTTNVNFSRTQLSMLSSLDNRIEKLCTKKQPPIVNEIKRHTAMLVKKC